MEFIGRIAVSGDTATSPLEALRPERVTQQDLVVVTGHVVGPLLKALRLIRKTAITGGSVGGPSATSTQRHAPVRATHGLVSARVTSITGRAVALGCGLAVTPLVVHSIGARMYGLYITVVTVTLIATAATSGVGNGLVRMVAADRAESGGVALPQIAGAALLAYGAISAIGFAFLFGAAWLLQPDWSTLLGLRGVPGGRGDDLAYLAFAVILLEPPLQAFGAIRLGLQQSYVSNLLIAGGAVGQFVGALIVATTHPTLYRFVFVEVVVPLLADGANMALLLLRSPTGRVLRLRASLTDLREIFRSGGAYSVVALSGVVGFQTDVFVIAHMLGPTAVSRYSIPLLAYGLLPSLAMLYLGPLLPSYTNALTRGDISWVSVTFRKTFWQVMSAVIVSCAILGLTIRPAIGLVISSQLRPSTDLILAFSGYSLVMAASVGPAILIAAEGRVRLQLFAAVGMAVVNLPASILLTHLVGLPGPLLGTILAQCFLTLVPYALLRSRWLPRPPVSLAAADHREVECESS